MGRTQVDPRPAETNTTAGHNRLRTATPHQALALYGRSIKAWLIRVFSQVFAGRPSAAGQMITAAHRKHFPVSYHRRPTLPAAWPQIRRISAVRELLRSDLDPTDLPTVRFNPCIRRHRRGVLEL